MKKTRNNILVIGDTQKPFEHPDYLAFCEAVAEKHSCGRIIDIGDTADCLNWSDYPANPDAPSAKQEIEALKERFEIWAAIFPKVEVVLGNHESRIRRRLDKAGFGESMLPIEQVLRLAFGLPRGWKIYDKVVAETPKGNVAFMHGDERGASIRPGSTSNIIGMSLVRGHNHSTFYLHYQLTFTDLRYDMMVGCGIDPNAIAFKYDKKNLKRPILGCGVIKNGVPKLIPMHLKNGRWTGQL